MTDKDLSLKDVLDPDEAVLWSGKPQDTRTTLWQSGDFAAGWILAIGLSAGAVAKGLDLFPGGYSGCRDAVRHCLPDYVFGTVFLVGAALILYTASRMSMSALQHRRAIESESYHITDRRALLLRTVQGRATIRSIPVHPDLWLSYTPHQGGDLGLSRMVQSESDDGSNAYDEEMVVFRNLPDPETPYRLLRTLQNPK
ncbi:MAG: hypothetical protein IT543_06940 [Tabrizicola sp.]|nr:hypothetical protein [Tabrizicola sp.]